MKTGLKILLLGRNGQVGWELQRSLGVLGDVVALDFDAADNPDGLCGDFTNLAGIKDTVHRVQPQIIVNAAAHTAVDKAEGEPAIARLINAQAPAALAHAATELGAWLVHYSTDYVFDGSGSQPWQETDAAKPLSVYGHTKLEGEQAVASTPKHLIFRTSWVYSSHGGNFAKTMLRLAAQRDSLNVIDDQIGAPTSAELLADVTAHALRTVLANSGHEGSGGGNPAANHLAGLYHCAAAGHTSWYGYCQAVLRQAQALGWALKAGPDQVQPIPTSAYPTVGRRPLNSRLSTTKLQTAFGLTLPPWQTGVTRMLIELSEQT